MTPAANVYWVLFIYIMALPKTFKVVFHGVTKSQR